ncbi:hypothetical protein RND71_042181 [Anisodus tanguticus]|uniref:Uncharacterized protein n=1 Tax=Anisodus tanguticus TaxID=243964 RepID=A0AAE1QPS9_9SOLA|nr:hypothetical protein RND71_042181 [Anisodus tanguticus]
MYVFVMLVVNISGDILKIKQGVESELVGEDGNRDHADANTNGNSCFELLKRRKVVKISKDYLKIKQEVESELFCEDANLGHADANRLFPRLEPMTSWSHDSNFTNYSKAPLQTINFVLPEVSSFMFL